MGLRYTPLKIFHFPEKLNSLPRETPEIRPPIHIRIKPTNACSHRCRYCAYRAPDLQLGADMDERQSIPRAKMIEIVEDVVAMGVSAITFSGGGDPFCYAHLLEAAQRLAESPVRFAALTNGARLDGDVAAVFARNATWLRVSIDGWDAESYARYRGVDLDEFPRVLRNIERFRAQGGPCHIGLNIVIDQSNAEHVLDLIRLAKSIGAHSAKLSPCIVSNCGPDNNTYHEPIFDAVTAQIETARGTLQDASFEIFNSYHRQEISFEKPYAWCPYLQILPVIGADLHVYACQDKAYNRASGCLGSIETMRFREFWMQDKARFFTVVPKRDCNHHCVADAKNRLVLEYLAADPEHLGFV